MPSTRNRTQGDYPVEGQTKLALVAIRKDPDVTNADEEVLSELRIPGLIYTARMPDGRRMAHLTERGRNALGLE